MLYNVTLEWVHGQSTCVHINITDPMCIHISTSRYSVTGEGITSYSLNLYQSIDLLTIKAAKVDFCCDLFFATLVKIMFDRWLMEMMFDING